MRRFRLKNVLDEKDMMVSAQLRCGCIIGEIDDKKGVILCKKHQEKELITGEKDGRL